MFYWKNAVVLIALLGFAMLPAYLVARNNRERGVVARLACAAAAVVLIAVSAVPLTPSLLLYALLLMMVTQPWLPLSATWLFLYVWTPAAGIYLGLNGIYLGVFNPTLALSLGLALIYLTSPAHRGRRGVDSSDIWLFLFLAIFCVCASLRGPWTGPPRLMVNYLLGYGISYQVLSRARIQNAELTLRFFITGVAAASLLCIFEMIWKWPLYSVLNIVKSGLLDGVPQMMLFRGGLVRAYGPFSHPLAGSAICGMAGVAFFALLQMRRSSWPITALGLMILMGGVATVSRTGVVAFSAGVGVFAALRGQRAIAILILGGGVALMFGAPLLLDEGLQASASYRVSLMTETPRLLGDHIWLGYREALSNGMLASLKQGQGIVDLVNVYVALLIYGGMASLLPYVIFLGTTIQRYRGLKRANPSPDQLLLGQACLSMQAGFFAMAPFIGAWSIPMLFSCIWIALLAALRAEALRVPERSVASLSPAPAPPPSPLAPHDRLPALR